MLVITEGVGRHTTRLCGPSESLDLVLIVAISVIEHTCMCIVRGYTMYGRIRDAEKGKTAQQKDKITQHNSPNTVYRVGFKPMYMYM